MMGRGETIGVFQVESAGMRKALAEMRADRFEDIIALVALYRPGPMANIPTYCARKLGQEKPEYLHPLMEASLRETFGVIIYQEQVMQIAQALSGYSLGEADMLRRAMGKKIKKEMDAQRARFVDGAVERGLTKAKADEIFDLLAKFADYGFNKSHAAAYALIAYWTAWFKANHPAEFLAASMTLDKGNTDKLAEFRGEAQRLGIRVAPPSANASEVDFDVRIARRRQGDDRLCAERRQRGRRRAGGGAGRGARRPSVRLARRHGGPARPEARQQEGAGKPRGGRDVRRARARPRRRVRLDRADAGDRQPRRVGEGVRPERAVRRRRGRAAQASGRAPWTEAERLKREFDAVGFFLSGHPLEAYDSALKRLRATRWADFVRSVRAGATTARLGASVLDRAERRTKTGSKMGIVQLSDPSGQYEAIVFQEGLNQ